MEKMSNPHYTDTCVIYRRQGATNFSPEGKTVEIYRGVCRKESSTNIRTFNVGTIAMGKIDAIDYRVSLPSIVKGIAKGDYIDITDDLSTEKCMRVVSFNSTRLNGGATELLCKSASV